MVRASPAEVKAFESIRAEGVPGFQLQRFFALFLLRGTAARA